MGWATFHSFLFTLLLLSVTTDLGSMTDGDTQELEPGSALPVPPDLDGDSPEDVNTPNLEFDEVEKPLHLFAAEAENGESADGERADSNFSEHYQGLEQEGVDSEHLPSTSAAGNEMPLSESEAKVLDAMVNQAMLGASMNSGLELPWETGVMASIFGDEPLTSMPAIPMLAHNMDGSRTRPVAETITDPKPMAKRQRVTNSTLKLYERAIRFRNNLTDHEADEARWNRALVKLYAVIIASPGTTPAGVKFQDGHMELNLKQLRVLCGSRSPNTVAKRASSLVNFCIWHKTFFYQKPPFPLDSEDVAEYIWEKHQDGMPYSTLSSFLEAVNFAVHVMGLPLNRPEAPIVSAFTRGVLEQAAPKRPVRKQARPLKVSEVIMLEEMLNNESLDVYDRYAAGAFLFAIFARCRWSDLRSVHDWELDIDCSQDKLVGFISFSTFSYKTAAQVAKHGLPMPLIAPIWGLCAPAWGMTWKKVAEAVSLDFANFGKRAVLPAPNKDGKWGQRSVTTEEASRWLIELLTAHGGDITDVSTHSLKATTLSWLAKAGSDPHHRTILGHHSSGKGSLEVYSRDMLSAPLRTLEDILRQIRIGALHPDLTRSGHLQAPSKPDCKDAPLVNVDETTEKKDADSSSSSSDTSSSSSSEDEKENQWLELGDSDPAVRHSAWGDFNMYQHEVSKIVHVEADSETCTFKCGLKATSEHSLIFSTAFLETRKCKRCLRAVDSST